MSRPLRIEYPGALYHVTSRGDRREAIYLNDGDRHQFIALLGTVCERFNWRCHAYCLMTNHYHLVVCTPEPNLSKGMRQLNGVYTQKFNHWHGHVGHVFQGRYSAILVDNDAYLQELSRYVVLNPVRAGMVAAAEQWPWSSYHATMGNRACPDWLETDSLLSQFNQNSQTARLRYAQFVAAAENQSSIWRNLCQQIYLGNEDFVEKVQRSLPVQERIAEIPNVQQRPVASSLENCVENCSHRKEAMRAAFETGDFTLKEIADFFGVHYSTVSRAING